LKTVGALLAWLQASFSEHHWSDSRREATELLSSFLDISPGDLFFQLEKPLTEQEWESASQWLKRRLQGEPLAYISGSVDFYDCKITVNSHVLIPRQETEILVDRIVEELATEDLSNRTLWDLCTGSGCIGIALKKRFPALTVYLSDISAEALAVTAKNAEENRVHVELKQGNLLEPFKGLKTHYLVCNPPYISMEEYKQLDSSVLDFEPKLALVGGVHGDEFYQKLAAQLPHYLFPHGKVWLEIGFQQGERVRQLFNDPFWVKKEIENDWAGHQRFFFLETE